MAQKAFGPSNQYVLALTPTSERARSTMPVPLRNIIRPTVAVTTRGMTYGTRYQERKNDRPANRWLTVSAPRIPMGVATRVDNTANLMLTSTPWAAEPTAELVLSSV